ncbi:hypothetical protein D3C72_2419960 [compost metagenome]
MDVPLQKSRTIRPEEKQAYQVVGWLATEIAIPDSFENLDCIEKLGILMTTTVSFVTNRVTSKATP